MAGACWVVNRPRTSLGFPRSMKSDPMSQPARRPSRVQPMRCSLSLKADFVRSGAPGLTRTPAFWFVGSGPCIISNLEALPTIAINCAKLPGFKDFQEVRARGQHWCEMLLCIEWAQNRAQSFCLSHCLGPSPHVWNSSRAGSIGFNTGATARDNGVCAKNPPPLRHRGPRCAGGANPRQCCHPAPGRAQDP